LKNVATLVAVLMAVLASWQHFAARTERVKAEDAYRLTRELSVEFARGSALLASYLGFYEVMPGKESRRYLYGSTLERSMAILTEAGIDPKAVRDLQVLKGVVNVYDTGSGEMLSRYSDERLRRESGWLTQP
jgi:hypothetical protein